MTGFPLIWVLADDRAGNVGQCLGVAEALRLPFQVKEIRYDRWGGLPNWLKGASRLGTQGDLAPPWPHLVIAAGRRTAPLARWIKAQSGAKLVQIMDPGPGGRGDFDLIVQPNHDGSRLKGPQILPVTGAPHRVTPEKLAQAAQLWAPRFAHLPRPFIGLIVGGATKNRPFTAAMAADLGKAVSAMGGGAVLVTTSRRTGSEAETALFAHLPECRFDFRWGSSGDNPYFGILALADALVVTGDSVSMACEACAATAPVFLYAPPGFAAPKHQRLHQELYDLGLARPLGQDAGGMQSHAPLNIAAKIAQAIRDRLF